MFFSEGFLDGKGQPREVNWIIGVSKIKVIHFKSFLYERGRRNLLLLEQINHKFLPIQFLILQNPSISYGPFNAECQARKSFLPDFSNFLCNSRYKRAIFLVNIPDLIYLEEKVNKIIFFQMKTINSHN